MVLKLDIDLNVLCDVSPMILYMNELERPNVDRTMLDMSIPRYIYVFGQGN